jgi:hypothetical protein
MGPAGESGNVDDGLGVLIAVVRSSIFASSLRIALIAKVNDWSFFVLRGA